MMNILVLAGGLSPERDVSLSSGKEICSALIRKGHKAYLMDIFFGLEDAPCPIRDIFDLPDHGLGIASQVKPTLPNIPYLRSLRKDDSLSSFGPHVVEACRAADITFLALHGDIGENGKVQAAFDVLGIPYTGPNSLGCALSMNKLIAKQLFKMNGVPTPRGTSINIATKDKPLSELGYYLPLVVKPCSGGSSIGVYIVHTEEEYREAVNASFKLYPHEDLVIEPYIRGREFACGIFAGKALPLVEIIPRDGLFNYENKYQSGGAQEICPPTSIDEELQQKIRAAGERAFEILHMDTYSRADFIVDDEDGAFYCLEMNSLPGMTGASLLPKAVKAEGTSYDDFCEKIIFESMKMRKAEGDE